jgi:hypothetical protein
MAENYQTYTATVEITYSSEVFPGDPDDVFQLADLEKPWLEDTLIKSLDILDNDDSYARIEVLKVIPGE